MNNKTNRFIILTIGLILWYFFILNQIHVPLSDAVMFSSSDSLSYLSVSDWIASGKDTMFVEYRPFLFPFLLLILKSVGGVFLIWIFQLILWVISVNLIGASIYKLTNNRALSFVGGVIFITNLSVIALTLHALTEILNIFLLSVLVWYFIKNFSKRKNLTFILTIILLFSLLVLNKPAYSIPLWILLIAILPVFYLKRFIQKPIALVYLILVLSPVITQVAIMKVKYDTYSISNISGRTFERYLLVQGMQEIEDLDRPEALILAENMSTDDQHDYFKRNLGLYLNIFLQNIESNIKEKSTFLQFPAGHGNLYLATKMKSVNFLYWCIHLVFLPLSLLMFIISLFTKRTENAIIIASILGLSFYYVFITGISFFQGDRLVLGALPLWIIGYAFIGYQLALVIIKKVRKVES